MNLKTFRINPVFEEKVWGGQALREQFHFKTELDNIAEAYCVIAIPNHLDCEVDGTGKKLSDFYHENPELFNCESEDLPVRLVLGSSEGNLSVQLHPEDDYALSHNGIRGKHEGELVIWGEENGRMVLGHKARTIEEFRDMAENGKWDELLSYIYPKTDDYVLIPYNTIHASQGKSIIAAFSTNGDVTYRLYDYDRNDPNRPLHKQEVYDNVICPATMGGIIEYEVSQKDGYSESIFFDEPGLYTAGRLRFQKDCVYDRSEFYFVTCIGGSGRIEGQNFEPGDTYFIPCGYGPVAFGGSLDTVFISYRNKS